MFEVNSKEVLPEVIVTEETSHNSVNDFLNGVSSSEPVEPVKPEEVTPVEPVEIADEPIKEEIYCVALLVPGINIRSNPSYDSNILGELWGLDSIHAICYADGEWGKLESGRGWINLTFTRVI